MATRLRFFGEFVALSKVFKVSIAALFATLAFGIYDFTIPYFTEDFATKYTIIAISISLVYVASFFAEVPVGLLTDRFGRRNVLLTAFGLMAIIGMGLYLTGHIIHLMILEFIFGIVAVAFWVPSTVLIRDYSPKKMFSQSQAIYLSFTQLGWIIGPMIAGAVATFFLLKHNFLIFSVLLACGLAYSIVFVKKVKIKKRKISSISRLFALTKSFKVYARAHAHALTLYFLSAAVYMWIGTQWIFVQLASEHIFGFTELMAGFLLGAMMAIEGVLYYSSGYLMDKIGPRHIVASGFILLCGSMLYAFISVSGVMFIFCMLLAAGAVAWILPGTEAIATKIMPKAEKRGELSGVFDSSKDLGLILGPVVGGILADFFGTPIQPFLWIAIMAAVAAIVSARLWLKK